MGIQGTRIVYFVGCFVLLSAMLSTDVESKLEEQESLLAHLLDSGAINQEMAELLQNDCAPEFSHSKKALQDLELHFLEQRSGDNNEFLNGGSDGSKMYDVVDVLLPQINNILVDSVRRKKLILNSGEDKGLDAWYTRYFRFLFTLHWSPTRRVLAQTSGEAPAPSPAASSPSPAPSLPQPPTDPPSNPPLPFFPRDSNVQPSGGEQDSSANSNASHQKTNKKTVVIAVVLTAFVTLLIAVLLFLFWRRCCGDRFRRRKNDERPLLSLSLNDYSIASSYGLGASGNEEKMGNESVHNKVNHNKVNASFYTEAQALNSSKTEIPVGTAAGFATTNNVEDPLRMPPGVWSAQSPLKPPPGRTGPLKPPPGRAYPPRPPPGRIDPPKPPPGNADPPKLLHGRTDPLKPPPVRVNSSNLPPGNAAPPPPPAAVPSSIPPVNPFSDDPHTPPPGPPSPPPVASVNAGPHPPPPPPPMPNVKAGSHPPPPPPRAGPPPPPPRAGPPPPPPRAGPPPPMPPPMGLKPSQPIPPGPRPPSGSTSVEESDPGSSKAKLKPFFWDKVLANPDHSMVWHQIKSGSFQFNEEMIETLFGYAPAGKAKNEVRKESSSNDVTPQYIKIIDPKKAQNIAILLKALNVTTEEVSDALVQGNELSPELVQTLLKMAPTNDEELKLRVYSGELSQLGPAERFLKVLVDIPFAFKRLESLLFMCTLQEETSTLKESFTVLEAACTELRKSRLFLKLLEAVLKTGNRMNDGTFRGGAQAFKLDTLLKLADVKGTDGKTTLLHFVVEEIIRSEGKRAARMAKETGNLPEDMDPDSDEQLRSIGLQVVSGLDNELQNVTKAAILDADSITGTVVKLGQELRKVRNFLNSDMKNIEKDDGFHQILRNFVHNAEIDVTWALEEEKRIMALVKSTADYFHGNAGKDEGLRLFSIVRDFLKILDKVCMEIKKTPINPSRAPRKGATTTSPDLRQAAPLDPRQRLFPAIVDRRIDTSSSDDES